LRPTGPHHSRRGYLNGSFYIAAHTRVRPCAFPQEPLLVARLVTGQSLYNSMPSETPEGRSALVIDALPAWPAPDLTGSALSQNTCFSGLCVGFRATPFTSLYALIFPFGFRRSVITLPSRLLGVTRESFPLTRLSHNWQHCQVTQVLQSSIRSLERFEPARPFYPRFLVFFRAPAVPGGSRGETWPCATAYKFDPIFFPVSSALY
jgi:hypothetical protein